MKNVLKAKFFSLTLSLLFLLSSCKKDNGSDNKVPSEIVIPPMEYYRNINQIVTPGSFGFRFDVDHDEKPDLLFNTRLVGDPIQGVDKVQFFVLSYPTTSLPVNSSERVPKLTNGDSIPPSNFGGYTWYRASSIVLAEKIIGTNSFWWEGDWINTSHMILPFQTTRSGGNYNGWLELSFDSSNAQLIIHQAAICMQPSRTCYAGK